MDHEEITTTTTTTTTLTILPCHLSLVHIPLDNVNQLMHPILQTWWYRDSHQHEQATTRRDPFFALCRNQLELSLFASSRIIKQNFGTYYPSKAQEGRDSTLEDKVLISDHPWIALEICVAVNGIEEAGHRIHTLTSPLAALSISILFLSTFSSDFILVRAKDLSTVIQVLQQEGFTFNDDEDDLDYGIDGEGGGGGFSELEEELQKSFESIQGGPSHHSLSSRSLSMSLHERSPSSSPQLSRHNSHSSKSRPPPARSSSLPIPNNDHPPPPPKLSRLSTNSKLKHQNLINLGLSLDPFHLEISRKKLLQLLFYPETLLSSSSSSSSTSSRSSRTRSRNSRNERDKTGKDQVQEEGIYCSIVETNDSISLTSDLRILRKLFCDSSGGAINGEEMVYVSGAGGLGGGEWEGESESGSESGSSSDENEETESSSDESEQREVDARAMEGKGNPVEREGEEVEEEGWENVARKETRRESVTSDRISIQDGGRTLLECLQLDLLSLGLDASGLAHHYAAVLIEGGVKNFMLQSTFGSANLLVSKKEARRARELLLSQSSSS
ncbi:hypothetical protein JCM3765_001552 [Sporobolomyces pararoseus]